MASPLTRTFANSLIFAFFQLKLPFFLKHCPFPPGGTFSSLLRRSRPKIQNPDDYVAQLEFFRIRVCRNVMNVPCLSQTLPTSFTFRVLQIFFTYWSVRPVHVVRPTRLFGLAGPPPQAPPPPARKPPLDPPYSLKSCIKGLQIEICDPSSCALFNPDPFFFSFYGTKLSHLRQAPPHSSSLFLLST